MLMPSTGFNIEYVFGKRDRMKIVTKKCRYHFNSLLFIGWHKWTCGHSGNQCIGWTRFLCQCTSKLLRETFQPIMQHEKCNNKNYIMFFSYHKPIVNNTDQTDKNKIFHLLLVHCHLPTDPKTRATYGDSVRYDQRVLKCFGNWGNLIVPKL